MNETWTADETELKANANKRTRNKIPVKTIMIENEVNLKKVNMFREKQGLKALKPEPSKTVYKPTNFSPVVGDARLLITATRMYHL